MSGAENHIAWWRPGDGCNGMNADKRGSDQQLNHKGHEGRPIIEPPSTPRTTRTEKSGLTGLTKSTRNIPSCPRVSRGFEECACAHWSRRTPDAMQRGGPGGVLRRDGVVGGNVPAHLRAAFTCCKKADGEERRKLGRITTSPPARGGVARSAGVVGDESRPSGQR